MWELVGVLVCMAYITRSAKSVFWDLRYRDLDTGKWRSRSTKCRADDPKQTRAAQRMAEEATAIEAKVAPDGGGDFAKWSFDYIRRHYESPSSRKRYEAAWLRILEWGRLRGIRHPGHVRYEHASDFMEWRVKSGASHNTARLELKFLSFMLQEAMRRDLIQKNPIALAKIPRAPAKLKPDLDSADFKKARAAFSSDEASPWMLTVFEICAHLGCRFREAELREEDVDFKDGIIWITDSKRKPGDPRKKFSVPMPDTLQRHLKKVFKTRKRTAPDLSWGEHNRRFNLVLKAATGATSHSLRVAFVTRCHRAGLSESQAMRLVNHSTRLVHAVYSRLSVNDAKEAAARVLPPA